MNKFLKEFILWILILLPIIYLDSIWQQLPEIVPTHFNSKGVANGWSHKSLLIILSVGLSVGLYLIMLIIPILDPRKNIKKMGDKYYTIRLVLSIITASIITFIIYGSNGGALHNSKLVMALVGISLAVVGILFRTIKPNHFIGIRTPWTLESDYNWQKTHQLAAPLWIGGGLIIALSPFIIPHEKMMVFVTMGITLVIAFVPFVYSYFVYLKEDD